MVRAAVDRSTLSTHGVERSDFPFRCLVALGFVLGIRVSIQPAIPFLARITALCPLQDDRRTRAEAACNTRGTSAEGTPALSSGLRVIEPGRAALCPPRRALAVRRQYSSYQRYGRGPRSFRARRIP